VDIHFYPYPFGAAPETLGIMVANAKCAMSNFGISAKPLWNTEFGWGLNSDLPNSSDQVAWLGRAFLYLSSKNVARSYWYAYDNNAWGTLYNGSLTAVGGAYQQIYSWMAGSTITAPCALANAIWTCGLTLGNGNQALAVWLNVFTSTSTQSYTPPSQFTTYRDLAGNTKTISGPVAIGEQPILLQSVQSVGAPNPPTGLAAIVQ